MVKQLFGYFLQFKLHLWFLISLQMLHFILSDWELKEYDKFNSLTYRASILKCQLRCRSRIVHVLKKTFSPQESKTFSAFRSPSFPTTSILLKLRVWRFPRSSLQQPQAIHLVRLFFRVPNETWSKCTRELSWRLCSCDRLMIPRKSILCELYPTSVMVYRSIPFKIDLWLSNGLLR